MNTVPGETLVQFLERRQPELEAQISHLRGVLEPKEAELVQIKKMRELLSVARKAGASNAVIGPPVQSQLAGYVIDLTEPSQLQVAANLTIKQMIITALRDHFREGATPSDLRDYMKTVYGREVDRNSISPQLARLRGQGAVEQYGLEGKWKLTRAAKWYDHPSSWEDLDKDEPADPNAPNTRLGDMHAKPAAPIGVTVRSSVLRTKKRDDFLD